MTSPEIFPSILVVPTHSSGPIDVHLTQSGSGPTYLFLHGGGGPQAMAGFAALFAEAHPIRVLTPTHPGFGGTPRPDTFTSVRELATVYVAVLDQLDLTDVIVVGNSVGGWVAAEMALLHSPRITGVVLLDAVGIEVRGHPVADFFSLSLQEMSARTFHDPDKFRIDLTALPPAALAALPGNRASLAAYAGPTMNDPSLAERLRDIDIPALVLWGESDRVAELTYGQSYAELIPNAQFQVLSECGHMPQVETPTQVADTIATFRQNPHFTIESAQAMEKTMWNIEYTAQTELSPETVWRALQALQTGEEPLGTDDLRKLDGAFEVGGTISVKPAGLQPVTSTITELEDNYLLAEQTPFNGLILLLRHVLQPQQNGGTLISRQLEISGENADDQATIAGPRISEEYPNDLEKIIETAHHLHR